MTRRLRLAFYKLEMRLNSRPPFVVIRPGGSPLSISGRRETDSLITTPVSCTALSFIVKICHPVGADCALEMRPDIERLALVRL